VKEQLPKDKLAKVWKHLVDLKTEGDKPLCYRDITEKVILSAGRSLTEHEENILERQQLCKTIQNIRAYLRKEFSTVDVDLAIQEKCTWRGVAEESLTLKQLQKEEQDILYVGWLLRTKYIYKACQRILDDLQVEHINTLSWEEIFEIHEEDTDLSGAATAVYDVLMDEDNLSLPNISHEEKMLILAERVYLVEAKNREELRFAKMRMWIYIRYRHSDELTASRELARKVRKLEVAFERVQQENEQLRVRFNDDYRGEVVDDREDV